MQNERKFVPRFENLTGITKSEPGGGVRYTGG